MANETMHEARQQRGGGAKRAEGGPARNQRWTAQVPPPLAYLQNGVNDI